MTGFLEGILRRRADFGEQLKEPAAARAFARSATLWMIGLGAFYGFTMGAYNLIQAGTLWNAVTSMVKVQILLLAGWILIFGLVGMQGAWMLRPFIGDPDVKFRAFRYINGNIFKELGRPIWRMTRDGERPRQQRPQPEERRY